MKILAIDFEYNRTSEKHLNLVCCSAYASETKETKSFWLDGSVSSAASLRNYLVVADTCGYVFLAHNVVAEASSFISLGLDPTEFKWIDTFIEFRMLTNHNSDFTYGNQLFDGSMVRLPQPEPWGKQPRKLTHGYAQMVYKLLKVKIDTDHKNEMRDLIISCPDEFTPKQQIDIMKYCESDLTYLIPCLKKIVDYYKVHLKDRDIKDEMLWRGESSARTAIMEREGYPILYEETRNFSRSVPQMLKEVQKDINSQFPDIKPFEYIKRTQKYTMKTKRIMDWVDTTEFKDRWELTATEKYSLGLDAFKKFFNYRHNYPRDNFGAQMVRFLHLKQGLNGFMPSEGKRKTIWDSTGSDGRVRPYLNPYGSQSARWQPSATSFIFLKAAWMRVLCQSDKGKMIVGIDYKSEEFLISAIISKDKAMYDAYVSGDVYLAFGKDSGVIPKDGTKHSHPVERQMCKGVVLGLSYGMTKVGLSLALSAELKREVSEDEAQEWIDRFKETYPDNTEWREDIADQYQDDGKICLLDGWTMWDSNLNERSVANVPIQGAGSCILRKAVQLCQDAGLKVIIPLHDALYVEMDSGDWNSVDVFAQCMRDAFTHYFKGTDEAWATSIGLDVEAWGPDLDNDSIIHTGFNKVKCETLHIDERSIEEYEQFSKYFKQPDIDLV